MADAEPLLASAHTASELESMPLLSPDEEQHWLNTYMPVVVLDSREEHFPCSAEYFIRNSYLEVCHVKDPSSGAKIDKSDWKYELSHASGELQPHLLGEIQAEGHEPVTSRCWGPDRSRYVMRPHRDVWAGQPDQLADVPLYGFARRVPLSELHEGYSGEPIIEIKYLFLFTYNGSTFACGCTDVGTHEGDLEHIALRVEEHSGKVVELFFAAHSKEGRWIMAEDCEFFDGKNRRCYVYCARRSHSSAPMSGSICRIFGFANDSCDARGLVWNAPCCVRLHHSDAEPALTTPEWLRYRGRWGGLPAISSNWWFSHVGEQARRIRPGGESYLQTGNLPSVMNPRCGMCW